MGNTINILPILYDENSNPHFTPLKDFNKREWLSGNNYWFKMLEEISDIKFNYSENNTTLFILYNGQAEKFITQGEYFRNVKKLLDEGIYTKVVIFQNEVNWDTFERILDIEDFFYDIFRFDKRFVFVRNIFHSRYAFTKISTEFGFGCFPFQLLHNHSQSEGLNYNVEKNFHLFSANCNVKEDRLHFYEFLEKGNHWDKCNTSFFLPLLGSNSKKFNPSDYVSNLGKLDLSINYLPKKLKYDNDFEVKNLALKDSVESIFQVIFETRYHSHCGIVLSEKLFKGFLYKTPFITFAQHGTIKTLNDLGFHTFGWMIDESYDEEINDKKRLKMVLDEIERLLNTPMDVLETKIKQYQPELEWNRQLVKRFAEHHINKIINLFNVE